MNEIILLKSGEIALKGLNRSTFEDIMAKNARRRLQPLGEFKIWHAQSTTYVQPLAEGVDMDEAVRRLQTVFGIVAVTKSCVVEKDFSVICPAAAEYFAPQLSAARTFKVEAKRSDKSFPMKSPEISRELGGYLLSRFHHLKVKVEQPEITITVEIREQGAYIHANQLPGAGGIPVGTGGRAMLLLSGGIDSPVAGYMMAKRGLELAAVHFASPPYTSDRARQKALDLAQELTPYTGRIRLFVVPFTKLQELLRERCPEDYFTILMRRYMMRVAEQIALREGCGALITGESLGQVASQTMQAIGCTDLACRLPVLRPCIGMDKEEIVRISRKIETFETSILPYEDCCTVFTPRHPKTKPTVAAVEAIEAEMAIPEELVAEAAEQAGDQGAGVAHFIDIDADGVRCLRMLAAGAHSQAEAGLVEQDVAHDQRDDRNDHEPVELKLTHTDDEEILLLNVGDLGGDVAAAGGGSVHRLDRDGSGGSGQNVHGRAGDRLVSVEVDCRDRQKQGIDHARQSAGQNGRKDHDRAADGNRDKLHRQSAAEGADDHDAFQTDVHDAGTFRKAAAEGHQQQNRGKNQGVLKQ